MRLLGSFPGPAPYGTCPAVANRLIYLSPVPWKSYPQRPHQMVRHFLAKGGREVLWVDPYPARLPRLSDLSRRPRLLDQGTPTDSRIQVVGFPALPIEPLPGGFALNRFFLGRRFLRQARQFSSAGCCLLIGKPSALALHLVRCLPDLWTGYDAMDDFPEFHSGLARQAMAKREEELCGLVDAVVASSSFLAEKLRNHRPDLAVIRNAFDADVLPLPRWEPRGGEVFGYIGALGEWFDWGCVAALARSYPRADIRLIGPCLIPPPHRLPANVRILPPCPGAEVGRHLNEFRIGLIPFRQTPLTRGVDPIKYYEYRAVGLPVLSTTFGEMVTRQGQEGVYFLDGPGGIEASVAAALTYSPNPLQVQTWRRENSWRHRFSAARLFL